MNRKELLDFIIHRETPPAALKAVTHKDILLSFRARSIILKFLLFQFIGALFSLSVCPQFGLGLVQGHGIAHIFRLMGDAACAAFCGSLFLSSGVAVAFLGMKGEELWWVWRRFKYSLIFLPALLWSVLMLLNVGLSLPAETMKFHFTWVAAAIMAQALLMQLRSLAYFSGFLQNKSY